MKTTEMVFACKNCKKVFRKSVEYVETSEFLTLAGRLKNRMNTVHIVIIITLLKLVNQFLFWMSKEKTQDWIHGMCSFGY